MGFLKGIDKYQIKCLYLGPEENVIQQNQGNFKEKHPKDNGGSYYGKSCNILKKKKKTQKWF